MHSQQQAIWGHQSRDGSLFAQEFESQSKPAEVWIQLDDCEVNNTQLQHVLEYKTVPCKV